MVVLLVLELQPHRYPWKNYPLGSQIVLLLTLGTWPDFSSVSDSAQSFVAYLTHRVFLKGYKTGLDPAETTCTFLLFCVIASGYKCHLVVSVFCLFCIVLYRVEPSCVSEDMHVVIMWEFNANKLVCHLFSVVGNWCRGPLLLLLQWCVGSCVWITGE